jgi:tryptophan-rich sensory protein
MRRPLTYIVFLIAVLAIGLLIGTVTRPDGWYTGLAKPSFNPPSWVFGPVWTVLYVMIAVAGARTWESGSGGFGLWLGQMALNFAWSPVFFGLHRTGLALAIILALLALILTFIVRRWRADLVSALLFVPYAAWVGFASLLNAAIVALN